MQLAEHSSHAGCVCALTEFTAVGGLTLPGESSEMYWPEIATIKAL